jgi:hypothetical protein
MADLNAKISSNRKDPNSDPSNPSHLRSQDPQHHPDERVAAEPEPRRPKIPANKVQPYDGFSSSSSDVELNDILHDRNILREGEWRYI